MSVHVLVVGFLAAIEDADVITDEQRALVRERILAWRGRDASGTAG